MVEHFLLRASAGLVLVLLMALAAELLDVLRRDGYFDPCLEVHPSGELVCWCKRGHPGPHVDDIGGGAAVQW